MDKKRLAIFSLVSALASISVNGALEIIEEAETDIILGKEVETAVIQQAGQQTLFQNPLYYAGLGLLLILLILLLRKKRKERQDTELEIKRSVKCEGCSQEYGMLEPECPFCKRRNITLEEEEILEEKTHTNSKQMTLESTATIVPKLEEQKQKNEIKEIVADKKQSDEEKFEDQLPRVKYKMKKCKGCGFDIFLDDKVCQVCGKRQ